MSRIRVGNITVDQNTGLSAQQAEESQQRYGRNVLSPPKRTPWWVNLLEKFDDPSIKILLAAAVVSVAMTAAEKYLLHQPANFIDSVGIFIAVALATLVGFFSERNSAKAFEALNRVKEDIPIEILRDGHIQQVSILDIRVGDLVFLRPGNKIAADGVLLESIGLQIDESILTGESKPAKKHALPVESAAQLDLLAAFQQSDSTGGVSRESRVFRGTMINDGHGQMLVTAIGDNTEIGKIANQLADDESQAPTPLVAKLTVLAKQISVLGIAGAMLIFTVMTVIDLVHSPLLNQLLEGSTLVVIGIPVISLLVGIAFMQFCLRPFFASMEMELRSHRHQALAAIPAMVAAFTLLLSVWGMTLGAEQTIAFDLLQDMLLAFIVAVTVIVVAVPEGLPMMVTVSLALNMLKMARQNCLVRKLVASETIGSATVICSDKTGTLTQNRMQPVWILASDVNAETEMTNQAVANQAVANATTSPADQSPVAALQTTTSTAGQSLDSTLQATTADQSPVATQSQSPASAPMSSALSALATLPDGLRSYERSDLAAFTQSSVWLPFCESVAVNSTANLDVKPGATETAAVSGAGTLQRIGNPTECAILAFMYEHGFDYRPVRSAQTSIAEVPHNSQRKMSLVATSKDGLIQTYLKGAPERVLGLCSSVLIRGQAVSLEPFRAAILQACEQQAGQHALRILAIAVRTEQTSPQSFTLDEAALPRDFQLLALIGIADPIRVEVPPAVATCGSAGIQVKMITGDARPTAVAIARNAGILDENTLAGSEDSTGSEGGTDSEGSTNAEHRNAVMTSEQFSQIPDDQLPAIAQDIRVLARSTPSDKLRLVKALQATGQVVAMTGDGTNDAPALKRADVGLSMGISGTEVAKEASDIVLVNDNFQSIVTGVLWGRTLYHNIQRFLQFQLSVNAVALMCAVIGPAVGVPLPLTVVQLLWINIIMDTFAAIAYSTDPPRAFYMEQKPIPRNQHIITRGMLFSVVANSLFQVVILFCVLYFGWFLTDPSKRFAFFADSRGADYLAANLEALTVFFTTFVMFQFWHKFNCRALFHGESPFTMLWKNRLFIEIILTITVVQAVMVQASGYAHIGEIFRTTPLTGLQWLKICALTFTVVPFAWLCRQVEYWLGMENQ